jgi:hypothetical protein
VKQLARDLAVLVVAAVIFSLAFIVGDLLVYGRVNW